MTDFYDIITEILRDTKNECLKDTISLILEDYRNESHRMNELKKKEAGKELKFIDINSAMQDLIEKTEEREIQYFYPDKKTFNYKGKDYSVALVLGDVEITEDCKLVVKPYGAKHYIQKHGNQMVDKKKFTMKNMEKAMLNFHKAMDCGTWYKDKGYIDRLALTFGDYVYIICLANDESEITYLHNLFAPDNAYRQKYFNKKYEIPQNDIKTY